MIKKFLQHHPVHKKIVSYLDIIFLIRPTLFFAVWIVVVLGMVSINIDLNEDLLWMTAFSWKITFVFIGLTLLIGSAFILMQKDGQNNESNSLLVEHHVLIASRRSIGKILLILGGLILIISSWGIAILSFLIYYLLGIGFNQKPINWTSNPYLAWFMLSFVAILLYLIGCLLGYDNSSVINRDELFSTLFLHALSYVLSFSAILGLIIILDLKNKYLLINQESIEKFNSHNFLFIPLLLISLSLFFSFKLHDPLLSTAVLVYFPFFVFSGFRRLNKDIIRSIIYPIFIINFFALSYYPWLLLPLLITYYLSKYYYWHRFNWHYPTFLVEDD